MKISALPVTGVPMHSATPVSPDAPKPGFLKMVTNATPGPKEYNAQNQVLPISPFNEQTEGTVEATQPLSPQLNFLAKQKRALQLRERAIAERENALKSQGSGNPGIDISRLKSQPLSVLEELGVLGPEFYDQLTQSLMSGKSNSEVNSLKSDIATLKEEIDKKFVDKDAQTRKEALLSIKDEVDEIVSSNENFELIKGLKQSHEVVRLIDEYHKRYGKLLRFETACEWVEEQLLDDNKHLAGLKKFQRLMTPQQPAPQQRTSGMRTITNRDMASNVPLGRKERALAAWNQTRLR